MFAICHPEDSERQFQKMVKEAQNLISGLGLHHRVTRLAAQDISESMAKTYDLEVWIPSINEYKEVSSVSTAHTFQAVRGNIRYKDATTGKNRFVHTLNGSGLATSRVFPAILEQYQLSDGTVRVPEVLQQYVGKELLQSGG
jgi:seryl-tRNA synthetase